MLFKIYLGLIVVVSLITYILYSIDKKKAIKNQRRISEKVLLLFSFFFGSIGGIFAMYTKRHKTKHWYFVVINYLSLAIHIVLGVWLLSK